MHIPVLLNETIEYLNPAPGKVIVDCTLGFGGHSRELVRAGARVIGIEQDIEAIESISGDPGIKVIRGNFGKLGDLVKEKTDGFLFDLGVSSYQIDTPDRGFSIRSEGPLDMRMDKNAKLTAADIVNEYPEEELARIFFEYGEERFSRRVAKKISQVRNQNEIKTTGELKEIIEKAIPIWKKRESVTRIFQALRIAVNDELNNLSKGLQAAVELLRPQGRIVVISYHSLEDRLVKRFFKEKSDILKPITKKPVIATEAEIESNPRAKSAKLRAAEKL